MIQNYYKSYKIKKDKKIIIIKKLINLKAYIKGWKIRHIINSIKVQ